ncbi:MAG: hypothetical protein KDC95_01405 [Planctomycetes bacterium]|nr:hypothetical protein [Planctomycetota bacterium]
MAHQFKATMLGLALATLSSCVAHHDRFTSNGKNVDVKCSSVTLRSDKLGTSIDLTNISVRPRGGKRPCDVSICIQADANGDGKIDANEKRCIYDKPGEFVGFSRQRLTMAVQGEVESAAIVVESSDCDNPNDPPDRHIISIDRDGVHRLTKDRPVCVAFAGGASRTHYVELCPGYRGSTILTVGDVASRGGMLAKLGRQGAPDFLAAAVFVDDVIVSVLVGPKPASMTLPPIENRLGKVRVLTFTRALERCADFEIASTTVR